MTKKFAFLFPGQGAQYVGMGKDFYENFAVAKATFEEADDILKTNFSKTVFEGPAEELTLTKNSQTGIYVTSIAILRTLKDQFPDIKPAVCAGLSLGEYTALTAAGKISFQDCLPLVQARGSYMNDACVELPGTMQVVLGLDPETVESVLKSLGSSVWVANLNCPGQVVIAGVHADMASAAEKLKASGAKRVLPLEVSGAFHSPLMQPAQKRLEPMISAVKLKESGISLVMNVPGTFVQTLEEIRKFLIEQVTSPVRWERGVRAMTADNIDCYIEMGCGKTLSGMNKKIGVAQPTLSLEKIADLEAFSTLQDSLCNLC